ncbi:DNA-3-methyladenine glycosylase isoform X2 [Alosa sapidissima]|uniref:DNA-3-methyladenine glycosylase isoform X2 n=1 Tax=Alosa sapidissima TaxID=34773 RepID=UPI001C09F3A3|nr:DNA-3-methyladenine glycosylase isoform X2 [Alosa sapidissima]
MPARKRKSASVEHKTDTQSTVLKRGRQSVDKSNGADAEHNFKSQYFSCESNGLKLGQEFFNQPCVCLAKALIGKVLVRRCANGEELRGRVVETEAYLGGEDKASHSAGGKRTERNLAMFMKPGTIYVYPIYGIYLCMNISSQGEGAAVLLRALEPLQGHTVMRQLRGARRREGSRSLKDKELCNGPSKLCQALDVPRAFDRRDLADDAEVWLETDPGEIPLQEGEVVTSTRIGIESHGEWAAKPLRFYLRGHPCVSVLDKRAEEPGQQTSVELTTISEKSISE